MLAAKKSLRQRADDVLAKMEKLGLTFADVAGELYEPYLWARNVLTAAKNEEHVALCEAVVMGVEARRFTPFAPRRKDTEIDWDDQKNWAERLKGLLASRNDFAVLCGTNNGKVIKLLSGEHAATPEQKAAALAAFQKLEDGTIQRERAEAPLSWRGRIEACGMRVTEFAARHGLKADIMQSFCDGRRKPSCTTQRLISRAIAQEEAALFQINSEQEEE